jgi:hypothetical protein
MLEACGGALTNRFGQRIFYDPDGTMENSEGIWLVSAISGITWLYNPPTNNIG